jgi:hypothetical protein
MIMFITKGPLPKKVIKKYEEKLFEQCMKHHETVYSSFSQLGRNWEKTMMDGVEAIICCSRARERLKEVRKGKQVVNTIQPDTGIRFQVSSMFLKKCAGYLTSDPSQHERLHLVTGTVTPGGIRVLSWMEHVTFSKKSAGYVCADATDSHNKILSITEKEGHLLLAVFHSHINKGKGSTKASGIDMAHLKRQAQIGCDCLGGIFSLDGYIRFFSLKEFDIDVYGKGVDLVEDYPMEKVYKIKDWECAS